MAHYALLDENNIVVNVITGRDEYEVVDGISDWEEHYGNFHNLKCKRTSYNTQGNEHDLGGVPFRANYAQIGYTYDELLDAFIPPQPYPSWVLSEETCLWDPPVAHPGDDKPYFWNEDEISWDEIV